MRKLGSPHPNTKNNQLANDLDLSAKVLNSTEDAHRKSMSMFETDVS
jgi:hypothetical protein